MPGANGKAFYSRYSQNSREVCGKRLKMSKEQGAKERLKEVIKDNQCTCGLETKTIDETVDTILEILQKKGMK